MNQDEHAVELRCFLVKLIGQSLDSVWGVWNHATKQFEDDALVMQFSRCIFELNRNLLNHFGFTWDSIDLQEEPEWADNGAACEWRQTGDSDWNKVLGRRLNEVTFLEMELKVEIGTRSLSTWELIGVRLTFDDQEMSVFSGLGPVMFTSDDASTQSYRETRLTTKC